MIDRESDPLQDGAPAAPPIPSFDSLRAPRRRSAIDLLLPPAEPSVEAPVVEPTAFEATAPEAEDRRRLAQRTAPRRVGRPAGLGVRLGSCVTRLLAGGAGRALTGLRARLRG